ncbi:hypothetical protein BHE74_00007192 [Ensete ventricosum]|nr:hypothetical protein GW17_00000500 [Ensete ventricosum]RWW84208.1 hypothetical protein BHE74_00007192 [Ensete ventricosum]
MAVRTSLTEISMSITSVCLHIPCVGTLGMTWYGSIECSNPSLLPEPGKRRSIEEPFVKVAFAQIIFHLWLVQMVGDFFDQLKSRTKGYASMEYSFLGYTSVCNADLFLYFK